MSIPVELNDLASRNEALNERIGERLFDDPSGGASDDDLTTEEQLYLRVYQNKLVDAGLVAGGTPPSTPMPWHYWHKTRALTKLRMLRWFAFLLSATIGAGTGIYLLVSTVQVRVAYFFA
jgi:hypothetical protein